MYSWIFFVYSSSIGCLGSRPGRAVGGRPGRWPARSGGDGDERVRIAKEREGDGHDVKMEGVGENCGCHEAPRRRGAVKTGCSPSGLGSARTLPRIGVVNSVTDSPFLPPQPVEHDQRQPDSFREPVPSRTARAETSHRFLPLLVLLFVGSGCAALIYEVVWLQLLQLVIGSTAVSLGVLLGTFMGGMCLGSLLLPRFVSPRRHPLRVYAVLELGIGAIGAAGAVRHAARRAASTRDTPATACRASCSRGRGAASACCRPRC